MLLGRECFVECWPRRCEEGRVNAILVMPVVLAVHLVLLSKVHFVSSICSRHPRPEGRTGCLRFSFVFHPLASRTSLCTSVILRSILYRAYLIVFFLRLSSAMPPVQLTQFDVSSFPRSPFSPVSFRNCLRFRQTSARVCLVDYDCLMNIGWIMSISGITSCATTNQPTNRIDSNHPCPPPLLLLALPPPARA